MKTETTTESDKTVPGKGRKKKRTTKHDVFVEQFTTLMTKMKIDNETDPVTGFEKYIVKFDDDMIPKKAMPDIMKKVQEAGMMNKPMTLTSKHIKVTEFLPAQYATFSHFLPGKHMLSFEEAFLLSNIWSSSFSLLIGHGCGVT